MDFKERRASVGSQRLNTHHAQLASAPSKQRYRFIRKW
jgi:hypothetical protein